MREVRNQAVKEIVGVLAPKLLAEVSTHYSILPESWQMAHRCKRAKRQDFSLRGWNWRPCSREACFTDAGRVNLWSSQYCSLKLTALKQRKASYHDHDDELCS
jgi:hypothetical protein